MAESAAIPKEVPVPALSAAVCGRKHFRRDVPCQDACYAEITPRPFAVACDGRGSAPNSHWGSSRAVRDLRTWVRVNHLLLQQLLDEEVLPLEHSLMLELLEDQVHRCACMAQKACADERGGTPRDYEFTLLMFLGGKKRFLTIHVGDGAILGEWQGDTVLLSAPENGEFANHTRFVRYGSVSNFHLSLMPIHELRGVALMSDGTCDGLIEAGTFTPSPAFRHIWDGMRDGCFQRRDLLEFLTRADWEPRVQDDRCLSLLIMGAEKISPPDELASVSATNSKPDIMAETPTEFSPTNLLIGIAEDDSGNRIRHPASLTEYQKQQLSLARVQLLFLAILTLIVALQLFKSPETSPGRKPLPKKVGVAYGVQPSFLESDAHAPVSIPMQFSEPQFSISITSENDRKNIVLPPAVVKPLSNQDY